MQPRATMSSIMRKKSSHPDSTGSFFQESRKTLCLQQETGTVPSASGVSEDAACLPHPVADHPSALPSPSTSSPSSVSSFSLFTQPQPLYANCAALLYFPRDCTEDEKRFAFLCLFFYILFVCKYYKPVTVQYCIAECVSCVFRLTLMDL